MLDRSISLISRLFVCVFVVIIEGASPPPPSIFYMTSYEITDLEIFTHEIRDLEILTASQASQLSHPSQPRKVPLQNNMSIKCVTSYIRHIEITNF
jgi:hypothetical protein